MRKWEFVYEDTSTAWPWRWRRMNSQTEALEASSEAFKTLIECIRDAERNGYRPAVKLQIDGSASAYSARLHGTVQ